MISSLPKIFHESDSILKTAANEKKANNKCDSHHSKNNYANIVSSYSFSTASNINSKSDKYINVTGYLNIYENDPNTRQRNHDKGNTRRPVSHLETETRNRSSVEDESDECCCAEVGHPEMNYFEMDMRHNNGRKKSAGAMSGGNNEKETTNQETKSSTRTFRTSLNIFRTEPDNLSPWRRRSLTPDSAELMHIHNYRHRRRSNQHSVLYADLVIHDNNRSQLDPLFQNHPHSKFPNLRSASNMNYLNIDVRKTEILAEIDKGILCNDEQKKQLGVEAKDERLISYFDKNIHNSDKRRKANTDNVKEKRRNIIIDKLFNNFSKKFMKNK